ncbi:hypothetical protein [Solicola gregarius]|uniref:MinD-like ATPase involved in chromosome partitioning or flagellar assembly n=1 Tax=Solicola gregarius TaxID=2908642 RepID=A0AA46TJN1_9ACTN|nr:hypothetical protein [Solicola gregarius]UYM06320.1 hypothetical protein L0C25_04370 [Solicola gregarius]
MSGMLVAVCSDKGSPGVTTTALALGAMWPGEEVSVVELDLAGGDLGLRLRDENGAGLPSKPTVVAYAAATRGGGPAPLAPYAIGLGGGLGVVQAPMTREVMGALPNVLSSVAHSLGTGDGDVIADLGRIDSASPEIAIAAGADVLVVVARASRGAVRRLQERLSLLLSTVAGQRGGPIPTYVVLVCPRRYGRGHVSDIEAYLADRGVKVDGVGFIGWDPAGVERLERRGDRRGRRMRRTTLGRTSARVAETVATMSDGSGSYAESSTGVS